MSAKKSERLVNLAYLLLSSGRPLTKREIFNGIDGYRELTPSGQERTFERDKDDLRAQGIEIHTRKASDEWGAADTYVVERSEFELPPVELTEEEAAVLGVAAHVWDESGAAAQTTMAVAKLRAAGARIDAGTVGVRPVLGAREPSFEVLFDAVSAKRVVEFTYRGGEVRRVEPWSLPYRNGSWYLIGYDQSRAAPRCFKLARISTPPRAVGKDGAYVIPADHDPERSLADLAPAENTDVALVAVRSGHAPRFTRRGHLVESPVPLPAGFDCWSVPYNRHNDMVGEAASMARDAVVLQPTDLREAVVAHLRTMVDPVEAAGAHESQEQQ
ncbi:helix-turn-helix transcriptional regulator [Aestuariimicrobium sp. T2.26MG-19.2B]|uniref:helix-turn-helix transcriptional regulator n=1 Tax=Aestuariimicrobium sp. T2.26MG-19.2B TaxID=3040679 RepID=UPI002477BDCA|nr:WYL domain-containing protein [Aestuariimicrobium sp. T2.26MG-19.2B]CAI9408184.1 Protein PafB [Aestuariimicrobium sp. T2.26MG-19.2B]